MLPSLAVPRFFLYGEPPQDGDAGFVHIETIAHRSRIHGWRIRPHAHRDLHQLLIVAEGGGTAEAEGRTWTLSPCSLFCAPSGAVHGFTFEPETRGHVATASAGLVHALSVREPSLAELFREASLVRVGADAFARHGLAAAGEAFEAELLRPEAPSPLALEARLAVLLLAAVRAVQAAAQAEAAARSPQAALVVRFRELVEAQFRAGWDLARYADALAVSPGRLRAACVAVAGRAPMRLVHQRMILEARRVLTYSNLTVGETAFDLGFDDPAYFSRFFRNRTGEAPAAFRARLARAGDTDGWNAAPVKSRLRRRAVPPSVRQP